jgi:hypothetical protein
LTPAHVAQWHCARASLWTNDWAIGLLAVLGHFPKFAPVFERLKQFSQRLIDRLLPLSHFIPLAGHLAIAGLDLRISHSVRSTLTLVRLLPIDVGSVRHDAFSGSALIQKREKRNRFISRPGVTRSTRQSYPRAGPIWSHGRRPA